ncbi:hypothetical protein DCS_00391 [Drechmeria coniospora]|uniref:Uncharacterized protein n=1 Tax=Drechmeria coniospora TaxID=98403 RepID=A0A151GQC8_DRECN|nr:hypothetical protein DCS_00391 [Drechmeria coniospora]KYK59261.1 hypothetical protein DCS_00391 [Drechmeria coniospora]
MPTSSHTTQNEDCIRSPIPKAGRFNAVLKRVASSVLGPNLLCTGSFRVAVPDRYATVVIAFFRHAGHPNLNRAQNLPCDAGKTQDLLLFGFSMPDFPTIGPTNLHFVKQPRGRRQPWAWA